MEKSSINVNRIFVDGKTLNQISEESGIPLGTVQHRWTRGVHDYAGLVKPVKPHTDEVHRKIHKKAYCIMSASERVFERIYKLDVSLAEIERRTGVHHSTLYSFLYNGIDISSMRLAKICAFLGLSMDYVMGLAANGITKTGKEGNKK